MKPRSWAIQVKHGKVMGGAGVLMDAENVRVVEASAFEKAVETLKALVKNYEHPNHDHNWAFFMNEVIRQCLRELGELNE